MDTIFSKDKLYHLLICLVTAFGSTEFAIGAALGKEYGDKTAIGNHWCWLDLIADFIGILIGTLLRILLIHKWSWY